MVIHSSLPMASATSNPMSAIPIAKKKKCQRDTHDGERDGEEPSRQAARNQLNLNYFLDTYDFLAGIFPSYSHFSMRIAAS
jgi:hypothetical protein